MPCLWRIEITVQPPAPLSALEEVPSSDNSPLSSLDAYPVMKAELSPFSSRPVMFETEEVSVDSIPWSLFKHAADNVPATSSPWTLIVRRLLLAVIPLFINSLLNDGVVLYLFQTCIFICSQLGKENWNISLPTAFNERRKSVLSSSRSQAKVLTVGDFKSPNPRGCPWRRIIFSLPRLCSRSRTLAYFLRSKKNNGIVVI